MAILKIAKMGHPVLREKAKKVKDPTSKEVHSLINDMFETLADLGGTGVGLAAPQVHASLQIIIFEVPRNNSESVDQIPLTVLINPKIKILTKKTEIDWEGCLSVPGLRGKVERPKKIKYSGFNPKGKRIETIAEGFHARVVQHEYDHLLGVLYPQRMKDLSSLQFVSEVRHSEEN